MFGELSRKTLGLHPREKSRNKTILKKLYIGSKLIDIAKVGQILPEFPII